MDCLVSWSRILSWDLDQAGSADLLRRMKGCSCSVEVWAVGGSSASGRVSGARRLVVVEAAAPVLDGW